MKKKSTWMVWVALGALLLSSVSLAFSMAFGFRYEAQHVALEQVITELEDLRNNLKQWEQKWLAWDQAIQEWQKFQEDLKKTEEAVRKDLERLQEETEASSGEAEISLSQEQAYNSAIPVLEDGSPNPNFDPEAYPVKHDEWMAAYHQQIKSDPKTWPEPFWQPSPEEMSNYRYNPNEFPECSNLWLEYLRAETIVRREGWSMAGAALYDWERCAEAVLISP